MLKKLTSVFGESPFPLLLALFFSGIFFCSAYRTGASGADQMVPLLKLSATFFLFLFIAFSLLRDSVLRRLAHERELLPPGRGCGVSIWGIVLYKEVVKTLFGVGITLGWLAGMLFVADYFRDQFILVPILLGIPFSAVAFVPAYYLAVILDEATMGTG